MATPEAEAMAAIVEASAPHLKTVGFKKRRYGFNRATSDGLVQVVHFWMAPFEPSAWTEVPGLRERHYGDFRIDFGIWVPEMTRSSPPRSDWIKEYNCHLRRTVGQLLGTPNLWWHLHDDDAATEAHNALLLHGLPWLERFPTKAALLGAHEEHGSLAIGMSPAGALDIADLHDSLGNHDQARRVLESYVDEPVNIAHAQYLADYLTQRGHADLEARIRTRPKQQGPA